MKKIAAIILVIALALSLCGCNGAVTDKNDKIQIVTTVFPVYDFARNVAGDKADVELLLPPGGEAHSYEPTVQDMVKLQQCDLFIRLGEGAEPWTKSVAEEKSIGDVLSAMDCVNLKKDSHNDEHHGYEYDQHVWTSPKNAIEIVNAIKDALCRLDSENADYYSENAESYCQEISELDEKFTALTENTSKTVIFADRFPFKYFMEDYHLEWFAAYPGCSDETEPSAATVAQLIDIVTEENIKVVFYTETSDRKLADAVCKESGAEKRLFHSCHTLTGKETESGADYLSLMEDNYDALEAYLK